MNERFLFDDTYLKKYGYVIGTDEAGRGAGAGDVFAAAVCFININVNIKKRLDNLNDSKKLSPKERNSLYDIITQNSIWSVFQGSVEDIEKYNILNVSLNTMKKCVCDVISKLDNDKIIVLVDGNKKIPNIVFEQETIVKGDYKSAAISAASIIAKVERDRYMNKLDSEYPNYKWCENKGYMTKEHFESVDKYGFTKYHRQKYFEKHLEEKQLKLLF